VRKIKFSYPNGATIIGTLQDETEPELSDNLWNYLEKPQRFICHNNLSTGYSYGAHSRPSRHPGKIGFMGSPIGNHPVSYTQVNAGEMVWTGTRFFIAYGKCTEPGIMGAITVKVDPEYMKDFIEASHNVWLHTYEFHKLAVIEAERA
jgi:hypothetical protein